MKWCAVPVLPLAEACYFAVNMFLSEVFNIMMDNIQQVWCEANKVMRLCK